MRNVALTSRYHNSVIEVVSVFNTGMCSQFLSTDLPKLVETVQHNCDIADARFAGEDTLCIYLLKMREYYRWRTDASLNEPLDSEQLGNWIQHMEMNWEEMESQDYLPLKLGDQSYDRFDNRRINEIINPLGYVYSGGLGRRNQPVFFLGQLENVETTANCTVLISDKELARNIAAPPGMSHRGYIYVRRDALRRYLAMQIEEWRLSRKNEAMLNVMAHYGFDHTPDSALETLLDREQENLILHEIGERIAEELIGEGWRNVIKNTKDPIHELKLRAVRDNLADCVTSLPAFLSLRDQISLDFYYANMTPLRREMFPSFCAAYQSAKSVGDYRKLRNVVVQGRKHWLKMSRELVSFRERNFQRSKAVDIEYVDRLLERCVF